MKMAKIEQKPVENHNSALKQTIEFADIKNQYSYKEDLLCKYKLLDYSPRDGDRIALFQVGWVLVKDYVLFEWAPMIKKGEEAVIKFSSEFLPRNTTDYYQICYISAENQVQNASAPFQFILNEATPTSSCSLNNLNIEPVKKSRKSREQDKDRMIVKLKEENAILKECLKAVIEQRKLQSDKKYEDINNLREITEKLYSALKFQQTEMEILKTKLKQQDYVYNGNETGDFDLGDLGDLKGFPTFPMSE